MFLKEDVQHGAVLINRPPQRVFDPADLDAHFIGMPPGTATWCPVTEFLHEERRQFDVSLPQGLVTYLNAALAEQFLDGTLAEGKR